jgi:murein tripeptide amidase MpaA
MLLLGGRSLLRRSPTLRVARAPTLLMAVAARALSAPALPRPPSISAAFDSGNIEVKDVACGADDAHTFTLKIRPDAYTHGTDKTAHFQWFHFRASGVRGKKCTFVLENAGDASYPEGWEDYKTVASYDREDWFRIASTEYKGGKLSWTLTPERDSIWFAYFAPYSWERHERLVAELGAGLGTHTSIGETLEGRPLDLLTFGDGPLQLWATARQHPGESMARDRCGNQISGSVPMT